jgi:type II secretory pathway component PulC
VGMITRRHSSSLHATGHPAAIAGLGLLVCMVAGCAGTAKSPSTGAPPATATRPSPAADRLPAFTDRRRATAPDEIARAELQRYLDDGPQDFIQHVQVRPTFRAGKFAGWRILGYTGPGPIKIGDVVTRINGAPIERPEEFMRVWGGLKQRSTLLVELIRNGRPLSVRYRIID